MPNPKHILTQNDHSGSFKVICFGVNEKPLRGYVVQYYNCGLGCEGSEDIASEGSENRHFPRPQSYLMPSPANPREYVHKCYLVINQDPWAAFMSLTVSDSR